MKYIALISFIMTGCCALTYREYYEPKGSEYEEHAEWLGYSENVGAKQISICGFDYRIYSYKPTQETLLLFGPLIFPIIPGPLLSFDEYEFDGEFIAHISGDVVGDRMINDSMIVSAKIGNGMYEKIEYRKYDNNNIFDQNYNVMKRQNSITYGTISVYIPKNINPNISIQFKYSGNTCRDSAEVQFETVSDVSFGM